MLYIIFIKDVEYFLYILCNISMNKTRIIKEGNGVSHAACFAFCEVILGINLMEELNSIFKNKSNACLKDI